ncbi:MAG: hypothetical protein JOY69_09865 [Candidatus Eremiobacteraeota bacterium]|nr:hypothetical protein [Candidatus Eremiobacteraeota bacterium]
MERSIYVTAIIPRDGETLSDWIPRAPDSLAVPYFEVDEGAGTIFIAPQHARPAFCGDCSPAVADNAIARMRPSPLAPLGTPVRLTAERYGRIPRSYIRCELDRTLPPATQTLICEASPCDRVESLAAGHYPFCGKPSQLAAALLAEV